MYLSWIMCFSFLFHFFHLIFDLLSQSWIFLSWWAILSSCPGLSHVFFFFFSDHVQTLGNDNFLCEESTGTTWRQTEEQNWAVLYSSLFWVWRAPARTVESGDLGKDVTDLHRRCVKVGRQDITTEDYQTPGKQKISLSTNEVAETQK